MSMPKVIDNVDQKVQELNGIMYEHKSNEEGNELKIQKSI